MLQILHRECGSIPGQAQAQAKAGAAIPSRRTKCSCAAALPWIWGQTGYSLVKTSKRLVFAIIHSSETIERTSLQSLTLASLTFFFFCGNVSILMNLVMGKIPLGQNRREGPVPWYCKSRRSFPFVSGPGFRPGCAPAPMGTLARSRWLFCRGIFLWEPLLHCSAN